MSGSDHGDVVAGNIRRLRDSHALSLSALARRSGVAKATLSAIEQGDGNPTIATLHSVAAALRIPVSQLLGPHDVEGPRLVRGAGGSPGTDDVPIESFVPDGIVELYDLRYQPGDRFDFDAHRAGVVERVLVQTGTVRIGPEGATEVLEAGDYLTFTADRPHVYEVVGDEVVRATLLVTYPVPAPGDSPLHPETR